MAYPHGVSWTSWYDMLNRLQERMSRQDQELEALRLTVASLRDRVDDLERRPTTQIERIEYKFDQLKIERLDGTLHIGMPIPDGTNPLQETSPGMGGMDVKGDEGLAFGYTVSAPGSQPEAAPGSDSAVRTLEETQNEVGVYLDKDGAGELERLESELELTLDPYHRSLVLADLRRQLGPRIRYYMEASRPGTGRSADSLPGTPAELTIADLKTAMRNYLNGLKGDAPS